MINHEAFGRLHASFAIIRDSITILGYLADKKLKGIPISKEEQATVRDYREYVKIFINDNKKYEQRTD